MFLIIYHDEHSASDDNDEFNNETLEEANDTDAEIVCSICSAHLRKSSCFIREDEAAGNHANQEASLGANNRKAPKASSLSIK